MKKPDFKPLAVEFVRKHNCAATVPVEIVMEAMEIGACEAMEIANRKIGDALYELREQRARSR